MSFESEMNRVSIMRGLELARAEYWLGYQRGLLRANGEAIGTEAEHELWLSMSEDEPDTNRQQRGQGYRDALI